MRPRFILLADRAEAAEGSSGGKLNISGAGISHLVLPEVPAIGPNIALVCSLVIEDDDFDRPHTVSATILRRQDGHRLQGISGEMDGSRFRRRGDIEVQASIVVINFAGLLFESHGAYDLELLVDDKEIGSVPLFVLPSLPTEGDG